MNLIQEQYKLQEDSIQTLENKLIKNNLKKRTQESSFIKCYLQPISKEINKIRKEHLANPLSNILQDKRNQHIVFELIQKHQILFSTFNALERNLKKGKIANYLIEDISKMIASNLIDIINENKLFYKKNLFYQELIKIIVPSLEHMDISIEKYNLQQKQSFSLFTFLLTDMQIALLGFKTISQLLMQQKNDDDDKIQSNAEQTIIKDIGENIFYEVAQKLKKDYILIPEELTNEHLLEFSSEIFILFEFFQIIQKEEFSGEKAKLDLYQITQKFQKNAQILYDNIIEYTSPFFEPMVTKPLPWHTINDGGYLQGENVSPRFQLYIQKTTTRKDRQKLHQNTNNFSKKLLNAINIIQDTPWKINKKMLQAVVSLEKEFIKTQEALKKQEQNIKYQKKNFNQQIKSIKQKIDNISLKYRGKKEAIKEIIKNKEEQKKYIEEYIEQQKKETKGLWKKLFQIKKEKESLTKELNEKLAKLQVQKSLITLAKKYEKYEKIYFTWQVDFRGRAYPVQALLNPQGESLAKALLCFATKKKINENGVKWFQIHGANTYGIDKVSFHKRIIWVKEHQEHIQNLATLENPLEDSFLQKADKPFEFLAFCYEYSNYLKDPQNFESSLPIAVDGSNNGFQHIAALLHDIEGAKKVNVLPDKSIDGPADIYKEVSQKLQKLLSEIANDNFREEIKKTLPFINRNFVKKGVMTDSYGTGTKTKAKQLYEHLEKIGLSSEIIPKFALFIAKQLDKAIDEIAPSSALYKKWINKVGKNISKIPKEIVWHTPFINFEVRQYTYETKTKRISTTFNGFKNTISIQEYTNKIDTKKQAQGIAPNFIHSLDATHLYMTILSSHKKGLENFATVHDSFATHASDVETLVNTLKEEFIKLTEYDVLKHFQEELEITYGTDIIEKKINKLYVNKDFNIHSIKDSAYFFA